MIYALLVWEFLQIGLFAIGGGLVTVPFLFDLATQYAWFDNQQLTDIIAVAQALPGAVGINMAAYAGYYAAGLSGGVLAPVAEVLPSMIIIYIMARVLAKWHENKYVLMVLNGLKPAVLTLILAAGWTIAREIDFNYVSVILFAVLLAAMHFLRQNVVFYIIFAGAAGVLFKI